MKGHCKLCSELKDLQDSHFLSKGIYKMLRDDGYNNPNPWQLTKESVVQTSKQMTAYLLCQDCEQRFNKKGENWVLKHCLRKADKFPLAAILAARKPDVSNGTPTKVYYAHNIPEIDISALAYFAASIFWRGSIHPWNNNGSFPVTLGPFQEQFRRYLMGLEALPKDAALWVTVREGKDVSCLTFAPCGGREGNVHLYKFPMPGLAFVLVTGKNIPATFREYCFFRGPGNPITVTPLIEQFLANTAARMLSGMPAEKRP